MNGGTIVLNGTGTVWNVSVAPLTLTGGGSIQITDSSSTAKTFSGNGQVYNTKLQWNSTGTGGLTINGSNTFAEWDLECTTARTLTVQVNQNQFVSGQLTLTGAAGQLLTVVSSSPGTATVIRVRKGHFTEANTSRSADVQINQVEWGALPLMGVG
jgi:hypothetical protein